MLHLLACVLHFWPLKGNCLVIGILSSIIFLSSREGAVLPICQHVGLIVLTKVQLRMKWAIAFFFFFFFFFERVQAREEQRDRGRENLKAGSVLSVQSPMLDWNSRT